MVQAPIAKTDSFRESFEAKLLRAYATTDEADTVAAESLTRYEGVVRAVASAARTNGIRTLNVATRMQAEIPELENPQARERGVDYFRDAAHLTPEGNAAFATALVWLLVESDMLRQEAQPRSSP